MIQGTGITLQTEEDIAKWIAERKARWPSAKRVAEKVCPLVPVPDLDEVRRSTPALTPRRSRSAKRLLRVVSSLVEAEGGVEVEEEPHHGEPMTRRQWPRTGEEHRSRYPRYSQEGSSPAEAGNGDEEEEAQWAEAEDGVDGPSRRTLINRQITPQSTRNS